MTCDLVLEGCRPEPLACYLKALGVFRIVAEQADPAVHGSWRGDRFALRSRLDRDALLAFFLDAWQPTPVIAPWNKGSGFWPSTSDEALRAIEDSRDPRFADYAATIATARRAIHDLAMTDPPEKGALKTELITRLRATVSERALAWIDAAAVLTDEDPAYPALLGTGGNDGRQDFSNNFMQRVLMAIADSAALAASLFGGSSRTTVRESMGQFAPASLSRSNVWDFVLAVEGTLVLAGAATRRLEQDHRDTLAFPFHARAASAPSLADGEDGHGELWLPRWDNAAGFPEVRALFAEGRAKPHNGTANTGLDFARSVASLGVDRGLSEFVRYGLQPRNGKAHFAVSLGRVETRAVPEARLLDDLYTRDWFERFRRQATGKTAPAGIALACRRLEQAMFDAVVMANVRPVLLALGDVERALARSPAFAQDSFIEPIPHLPGTWAIAVRDGSVEQRLGAALAARLQMRRRLAPIDASQHHFVQPDATTVFGDRSLIDNLHELLAREDVEVQQGRAVAELAAAAAYCSLSDIARFIAGETDDVLLERWLRALVLTDPLAEGLPADTISPPATFAVLALAHSRVVGEDRLPRTATMLTRALAGDAPGATHAALARLRAAGRPLPVDALYEPPARMRRIAAALAFPLTRFQRRQLERLVLPRPTESPTAVAEENP